MKKLIYHIGACKTGAASLQYYLRDNQKRLGESGCGAFQPREQYPALLAGQNKTVLLPAERSGLFLERRAELKNTQDFSARYGTECCEITKNADKKNLADFKSCLRKYDTIILSNECAYEQPLDFWESFQEMVSEFGFSQIIFILYADRQDQLLSSFYKQNILENLPVPFMDALFDAPQDLFDLQGAVSRIEKVFGEGSVIVRRYGEQYLTSGDIRQDFCEAAGIPWDPDFILADDPNPMISFDAAEVKRLMNLSPSYAASDNFLYKAFLRSTAVIKDRPNEALLSSEDARRFLTLYAEGNRALAEHFFDGEALFDEVEDGIAAWERDTDRILDAAIIMLTEALGEPYDRFKFLIPKYRKLKHMLTVRNIIK